MEGLYRRDVGPSYVPSFAARLVLAIGKGVQRAAAELRNVFDEDVEGLWTLSLVVVQWYADSLPPAEAQAVASALQEFDMGALAANLNLFRSRLLPFVKAAHEARDEAQLAAAGAFFVGAVEQIGAGLLVSVLRAAPLGALKQRVLLRLPLPAGLKEDYARARGIEPARTAPSTPPSSPSSRASRADRFDRADFSPRPARVVKPREATALSAATVQPAAARAEAEPREAPRRAPSGDTPRPPAPSLDDATVTQAYLLTLNWKAEEVERLLAGPSGEKPRTVRGKRIA